MGRESRSSHADNTGIAYFFDKFFGFKTAEIFGFPEFAPFVFAVRFNNNRKIFKS